jgi:hypothetical protein
MSKTTKAVWKFCVWAEILTRYFPKVSQKHDLANFLGGILEVENINFLTGNGNPHLQHTVELFTT